MNYYSEGAMIVVIIVAGIIVLKYFGYLNCMSTATPSSNDNDGYKDTTNRDDNTVLTSFGRAVSLAPTETTPANNSLNFASTPEPPLPTKMAEQDDQIEPIPENKVILMSTLEKFPWNQIPSKVTYLEIDVEAFIGPQESENFLILSAGEGLLNIYSLQNQIVMTFGNISAVLTETGFTSPPIPIGTFTLSSKIKFHQKDKLFMELEAQAQVGDKQLKVNPNVVKKSSWGYDIRTLFQSTNKQMYQGVNVNGLQTTVKWKTIEKKQ
jgi:hypothetical protein